MNGCERLRGRGSFDALFASGRRTNGSLVRCLYRWEAGPGGKIVVGFSVPRRVGSAVRRNRLRRLMREAFRTCFPATKELLKCSNRAITLVFVIRNVPEQQRIRLGRSEMERDIMQICRSIAHSSVQEHP